MKYAQLVIGPAGTGKSTYCHALQEHASNVGRTIHVGNMDPAAESFKYSPAFGGWPLTLISLRWPSLPHAPHLCVYRPSGTHICR